MSDALRCAAVGACVILFSCVLYLVKHERLQLKYSLLWLAFGVAVIALALIPDPLFALGRLFGFATASNFIFFIGFIFLILIALSLSAIVSKQSTSIKNLTQRIAILECEIDRSDQPRGMHDR